MAMFASNTDPTTLLPPTTNFHGPSQRARLRKSTRKLESLLGSTAQVVESDKIYPTSSPITPSIYSAASHKSSGSVPVASRLSKNTITRKNSRRKSVQLQPPPLVLRLDNNSAVTKLNVIIEQSESSVDSAQVLTLPPPAISVTPSPLSSLFSSEDETTSPLQLPQDMIRRKRMAKLARTLGENIPTEFIIQHSKHFQHKRSPSEPGPRSLWPEWSKESEVVTSNTLLPPTINSLDPSQRTRLLKSTRKLETLLGATPQVVESDVVPAATTNPTHLHVSHGVRAFLESSADSVNPDESFEMVPTGPRLSQNGLTARHRKRRSLPLPRPLLLRHSGVPDATEPNIAIERQSSDDSGQVLALPPETPALLSPLFPKEDEPMTPMKIPQEKIHRRRMAKLTRTLGENIPTEFVLTRDHLQLSRHQRSPSAPSPSSSWPNWGREESQANTVSTNLLPPTINTLDPSQRARLLKSTRKLENLLGTTPQVVVSEVIPATTTHFYLSQDATGEESHDSSEMGPTAPRLFQNGHATKHKPVHLPRPLVLRHNNVTEAVANLHPPSSDSAQVLTLPSAEVAPLSPLFSIKDEPMSPAMEVPQEKIRRRRMAKLTRTLGESIPTEFILPHQYKHQRSPSEPSPHSLWPNLGKKGGEDTGLHPLSTQLSSNTSVLDNDPTNSNATTVPADRSNPAAIRKLRRRPASVGSEIVFSSRPFTIISSYPETPTTTASLSDSDTAEDYDFGVVGSDWRGEWNIKDAQERAMALRNLRN